MGEGHKTVLPSRAACRLDFRLVADEDPDTVLAALRRFLDEHDCADFAVEDMGSIEPSRTTLDTPFATLVADAARQVYGVEPSVRPSGNASGRQGVWGSGRPPGVATRPTSSSRSGITSTASATPRRSTSSSGSVAERHIP